MDFRELEERLVAFRDARGWKGHHTPKNLAISAAVVLAHELGIDLDDAVDEKIKKNAEKYPAKTSGQTRP